MAFVMADCQGIKIISGLLTLNDLTIFFLLVYCKRIIYCCGKIDKLTINLLT